MLVFRRVTHSIKFAGTHLYTWVERGTVRVKCLAQERNTMPPARARIRAARSGVKRANHEATACPENQRTRIKTLGARRETSTNSTLSTRLEPRPHQCREANIHTYTLTTAPFLLALNNNKYKNTRRSGTWRMARPLKTTAE